MRNQGFVIPIEFTWNVARCGYRWVTQSGERYLCAVDALEMPGGRDLLNRDQQTHRPLERHTGLFREFAALRPTEAQVLTFADRYGLLERGSNLECDTRFGRVAVHGEKLEDWKKEIMAMKAAVTLWDAISRGRKEKLAGFRRQFKLRSLPLEVQRRLHLDKDDPAMAAHSAVQRETDARLIRHVVSRLVFAGDQPRLQVCLAPQNLLGAMWLQFAASVDALKTFLKCAQCGAPFEISRSPTTGKRIDARFCSVRCRVNHNRGKKRQAHRLSEAGRSEREIARELKTRLRTIKGWLMQGKDGRARGRSRTPSSN